MKLKIRIVPISIHELIKALLGKPSSIISESSPIFGVLPPAASRPLASLYSFAPDTVLDIALNSMKTVCPIVTEKLNDRLAESGIDIKLASLEIDIDITKKYFNGITLELEHIGYKGLAEHFLPKLPDYLPEDYATLMRGMLEIIGDDREKLLNSVLDSLDDTKKAEITELIIRERNSDICDGIMGFAKDNGIDLEIVSVDIIQIR